MCLIINKPKGVSINPEWLDAGFANNGDGWGVMWSGGKKVMVEKGLKVEGLKECMGKLDADLPISVHMRTGTSGKKDLLNCHPMRVGNGMWLMHNGMIGIPMPNKEWSDTKHFTEFAAKPILSAYPALFGKKQLVGMLEYFVGANNKLLIMRGDGETMIVNESGGTWKDKCWLSNTYSIVPKKESKTDSHAFERGFYGATSYGEWEDYASRAGGWKEKGWKEKEEESKFEGHFCEMCRVYVQAKEGSWTQAAGVGWICGSCWKFVEDSIEAVQDIDLPDLSRMTYADIIEVCKNFPETIAWAIIANATKIQKMEKGEDENEGIRLNKKADSNESRQLNQIA